MGGLETMFNSMCSMTSSLQIAEDCLKSTSDADQGQDLGTPFEGVQKFAQTIDSGELDIWWNGELSIYKYTKHTSNF